MDKYTPESIIVRTPLDEIGSLLNVNRIPGEELRTYAERIYSTYVKRSNSTYQGLLNGINRALGIEEVDCIDVSIRSLLQCDLEDSDISYGTNYIEDNYYETGTVDGSSVIAVGTKFSVASAAWTPERLRGLHPLNTKRCMHEVKKFHMSQFLIKNFQFWSQERN